MKFSEQLKELRAEKKLTQKELAQYLGLSANIICEWEKERCEPNMQALKKMADIFECSLDYLIGRADDFGNITIQKENSAEDISAEEKALLKTYRALNAKNRMHVAAYAQVRLEEQK